MGVKTATKGTKGSRWTILPILATGDPRASGAQEPCCLEYDLLVLRERFPPYELHYFGERLFLLQDCAGLIAQGRVLRIELVEERLQNAHVLRRSVGPGEGWS